MKRKDILKQVYDLQTTTLDELFAVFEASSNTRKKRIKRIVSDYFKQGRIEIFSDTGEIRVPQSKTKKTGKTVHTTKKTGKTVHTTKKTNKSTHNLKDNRKTKKKIMPYDDVNRIIGKHEIRDRFPKSVLKELDGIKSKIDDREIRKRIDLRKKLIFTIDGADAKDLDDAISLEKKLNGWILGVHIADVSYYVQRKTKLDREAIKRGNSFYFINRVVPMFPEILSNGVCSLNPHTDKLTMSVFIHLSLDGKIKSYEIAETVINISYRLDYDGVQKFLDGKKQFDDKKLSNTLKQMDKLFRVLNKDRMDNGGIDFDFKEKKIVLDDEGNPTNVYLKERQDSERLIEEFMLLANKVIAQYLAQKGVSVFRVHEEPSNEKIQDFVRVAMKFGHKIYGVPVPDPLELQKVMREAADKPHKAFVTQVLLRSMQQARYQSENLGHYGLGFEYYTHFTSPIRRYADLIIHRLLKQHLQPLHSSKQNIAYSENELDEISSHISTTERIAVKAERDLYKIKSVRFMEDKIKQEFDGTVTGVSMFGVFVSIDKYGIEGLIRYLDMRDDYYEFSEGSYSAKGRRKKQSYTLGDKVRVKVVRVNVERFFLDMVFAK